MEKREPSCTTGGNVNWYSHYGEQYGGFLNKKNLQTEVSWCEVVVTQLCPTLCDPMNCNPPGSSVPGILQARILEWVVIPFSRGSSQPRDWIWVSQIVDRLLSESTGKSFELSYDPAIPLLGIYSEKIIPKDTCNPVFTAALLTKVRTWKQPKCQSRDEWIKSMRYTYV